MTKEQSKNEINKSSGFGKSIYPDGDKYEGEFLNNEPHGKGTLTTAEGGKYVGEFKDGLPNGQGTLAAAEGDKYVGEFKDGLPNGQGTLTTAEGDKYVGEVEDGLPNGQGTMTFSTGDRYEGNWEFWKKHGHGTYFFANGDKYEGEFEDDDCHGHGTRTYSNGSKYVGEWEYGKKNGKGTEIFTTGNKFEGEFKDGARNGQGTFTTAIGDKYVGEWKDGKQNGQGSMTYANGDKYVGEWGNGLPNGQGTYTFANGNKYEGEFKDSKRNGQGTYTFANGKKEEGEWKNNKLYSKYSNTSSKGVPQIDSDELLSRTKAIMSKVKELHNKFVENTRLKENPPLFFGKKSHMEKVEQNKREIDLFSKNIVSEVCEISIVTEQFMEREDAESAVFGREFMGMFAQEPKKWVAEPQPPAGIGTIIINLGWKFPQLFIELLYWSSLNTITTTFYQINEIEFGSKILKLFDENLKKEDIPSLFTNKFKSDTKLVIKLARLVSRALKTYLLYRNESWISLREFLAARDGDKAIVKVLKLLDMADKTNPQYNDLVQNLKNDINRSVNP